MNYLTHYTKKKQALGRKEVYLRRLIRRGVPHAKLIAAAEDVRNARIRVLRANRATIAPKDTASELYTKFDRKIRSLLGISPEKILAGFRPLSQSE